jgi:UDP-N-acetylmuramoyl-tripeptide--D-alanyl-D-alanine ligase
VINLRQIIKALTNTDVPLMDKNISSAIIDSRKATNNNLFIALPGERADGYQFLDDAFVNGASIALVDKETPKFNTIDLRKGYFNQEQIISKFPLCLRVENTLEALHQIAAYWRKANQVKTIGITGSVGKTSTKELTAALLSQKFKVLKNPGNRNNEIGLPLTLFDLDQTHEVAVLEMGFYVPGEIRTLCEIASPSIGVITNIGTVHAERAGSQEKIAQGKAELVQSLPAAPEGIAVLNIDDPWVRWMIPQTKAQVFTYGFQQEADLKASDITVYGLNGVGCTLSYQGKEHQIRSPLLGAFSVYTLLCATAVALSLNLDWQLIEQGLSTADVDLRMQHFSLPNGATVLDDTYNASPASMIAALELLSSFKGRRIAILGDMLELGQYEIHGHQSVGKLCPSAADLLILVGERTKTVAKTAMELGFPKEMVHWFPNSTDAAHPASTLVKEGDVILVKGSNSMQMDHIITALKEIA